MQKQTGSSICRPSVLSVPTCSLRTGLRGGAAATGWSAMPPGCRAATGRQCVCPAAPPALEGAAAVAAAAAAAAAATGAEAGTAAPEAAAPVAVTGCRDAAGAVAAGRAASTPAGRAAPLAATRAPRPCQRRPPATVQHHRPMTALLTTARHMKRCHTYACELPYGHCVPAGRALHAWRLHEMV